MDLSEYKFLVADDHFLPRQEIGKILGNLSIRTIDWAIDGQEALDKIKDAHEKGAPYHAVCLDWIMPKLNGLEVLQLCRQDKKFNSMAIIMVTAESEDGSIIRAIREGATTYITKPFEQQEMANKITELMSWLKKRHARAASA